MPAVYLESIGISSIDINMGCPVRKVCRVGGGSAMMTELDKTAALVRGMVEAVKFPSRPKNAPGLGRSKPDGARSGPGAGRRGRSGDFCAWADARAGLRRLGHLAGIRAVVQAVKHIPVIGNGDVTTPQAAEMMFAETGCAGVSMGRGAFLQPVDISAHRHYLRGDGLTPEPGI